MLGILKAGAAYLPIDPSWPDLRIDTMFAEAGVKAIVGSRAARNFGADLVWIDPHAEGTFTSPLERPAATGHELAYVIMTSGSTGRPKGVAVEHANIAQLVVRPGYVSLGPSERILHLAPGAFDAATFEIWAPLLNGGTVVVAPTTTPSFSELGDLIRSAGITTMWLTASFFNAVIDSRPAVLAPVRQLLIGGEALSVSHVRRALACLPNTRLINGYGPTETTTFASTYAIPRDVDDRWRSIPIGTPLRETSVFVIDDYGHPAPHGARGMLYIGGGGVSRGYLNRPEATAEAFLTGVIPDAPHMRVYRTGDEVRRRADGNLEFLGRRDGQVKLRGMRIELGEIESELRAHPDVADAAVVVAGEHPVERLVAYLVPRVMTEMIPDPRPRLATRLPAFMIPASIIVVPSLPRTYQGKLDRGALPETEAVARTADLPVSPTECRLAELWSALLGTPQVGRHDNFFALGGHSLLAARMSFQVLQQFGADVPIDRFYRDASLAAIAARIDEALATNAPDDRIVRRPRPARRLDT